MQVVIIKINTTSFHDGQRPKKPPQGIILCTKWCLLSVHILCGTYVHVHVVLLFLFLCPPYHLPPLPLIASDLLIFSPVHVCMTHANRSHTPLSLLETQTIGTCYFSLLSLCLLFSFALFFSPVHLCLLFLYLSPLYHLPPLPYLSPPLYICVDMTRSL